MYKKLISKLCEATESFIEKSVSRKFIVWTVATHMTYQGLLDGPNWMMVAMLYIGSEAVLDYRQHTVAKLTAERPLEPLRARDTAWQEDPNATRTDR